MCTVSLLDAGDMRCVSNTCMGDLKLHLSAGMCVCRVWWNGEVADAFLAT